MKVALVLGGGGARGLAHVGVLRTLEQEGIPIHLIVGCSFGALIGAMYAQMGRVRLVEERIYQFMQTKIYANLGIRHLQNGSPIFSDDPLRQFLKGVKNWVMINLLTRRAALLKGERLGRAIAYLVPPGDIRDTQIPFACLATDLVSGQPYLFTDGDIQLAVTASSTIPGYFPPVEYRDRKLVDGAVSYNLPIRFARLLGADRIIAVDVHPELEIETEFSNVMDILLRTKSITANILTEEIAAGADVLIAPPIKEYNWFEFDRFREIIRAGEEAARLRLADIRQLTSSPGEEEIRHSRLPGRTRRRRRIVSGNAS